MDDGNSWTGILLLLGAAFLYAVLYGFGAAVQSLNTSALEDEKDEGNVKAERLLHIQQSPVPFIRTNQLVTCLAGLLAGAFSLPWAAGELRNLLMRIPGMPGILSLPAACAAAVLLEAAFLICFGMVIPKRIAGKSPIRYCYKTLALVRVLVRIFRPVTWLIDAVGYGVLRVIGIDIHAKGENVTEEDIMYMVNEGHEQGVLEASEAEMITNIFEFDDKEASDIMTHRKNIVALDGQMTLAQSVDFIVKDAINSRFPVYEEDIDNIIGILHMRDVLYFAELKEYLNQPISKIDGLLREAHFIPETKNISALFKEMQSKKIHIEIVVDEYGQTSGLVTMEDILEEIVGNIMDEYDTEEPDIVDKGNGVFQLSGQASLGDVEDALKIEFDEDDKDNFDTLNGLLISRLGHLPAEDETAEVVCGSYCFRIVKAENKVIRTVVASPVSEKTDRQKEDAVSGNI